MLPKKVRRERSLSYPISGEPNAEEPSTSGEQTSQSASAVSKAISFFETPVGLSGPSTSDFPPATPSSSRGFSSRTPRGSSTTNPSSAASSSASWVDRASSSSGGGLISPRVFNFYDLPALPSERSRVRSGSRRSPILLGEDREPNGGNSGKLTPHLTCNICNKICGSQAQLILHQHSLHKFSCPICPEVFTKRSLLQTHMVQHYPNTEQYVCNIVDGCSRRFTTAALLQKHIEMDHLTGSFSTGSTTAAQTNVSFDSPNRQQRRTMSESSDWSPVPQRSPTSPTSFRTPTSSSTWNQADSSPAPSSELFRSPSGSIASPLCRRNQLGSEGGSFKPYRSPISTVSGIDWRAANKVLLQGMRDPSTSSQLAQLLLMQQTTEALANSTGSGSKFFEQHQNLQNFLYKTATSGGEGDPGSIITPQPLKQTLGILKRQHTLSESAIDSERKASRSEETMTPEPSPNLTKNVTSSSPMAPLNRLVLDVDTSAMGGLELLGQVSSHFSKLREGDSVKSKTKPAPLDLSSDSQLTLTPPHTSTPRYLWTPTKGTASAGSAFFCQDARKIRVGTEYQATIPDQITKVEPVTEETGMSRPLYIPAENPVEEERRDRWFIEMTTVYPDPEFLHHCVHRTGGDLVEAAKLARSPFGPLVPNDHPSYKYRYTSKWTQDDQEKFFLLFQKFGKDLSSISRCLPGRTLAEVVEYYYVWKVRYPELYRQWRRPPVIPQVPTTTARQNNTIGTEFDMRAAPKASRGRGRKEIVYFETEAYTTYDSKGDKEIKFRQKKVVNPYSSRPRSNKPPNPQPLGSYKCKVCGKEFQKVKSRSAHMKTHKRQQNAVSLLSAAAAGPTLLQQQYQQLHSQQQAQALHHQLQQQLKQAQAAMQHQDLTRDVIMSRDLSDVSMVTARGDHGAVSNAEVEEALARARQQQQHRSSGGDVVMTEAHKSLRTDHSSDVLSRVMTSSASSSQQDVTMTTSNPPTSGGR